MKKTLLIFSLLCGILAFSCKKANDTNTAQTQAQLLTQSPWKLTGIAFYFNGAWNAQPLDNYFLSFVRFNTITYAANGAFSYVDGNGVHDTGTYTVTATAITTSPTQQQTQAASIVTLSATTLVTSYTFSPIGFQDGKTSFTATGVQETFTH